MTEADFTPELCAQLVLEHGAMTFAAKALVGQVFSTRRPGMKLSFHRIEEYIRNGIRAGNDGQGIDLSRPSDPSRLNRIDDLLDRANVPLEALGSIQSSTLKAYGGFMKGTDGKPVKVPLYSTTIKIAPPDVAIVAEPHASTVKAYKLVGARDSKTKRVFIVGDQQMGFWAVLDPKNSQKISFTPFHDERAQDIYLQAIALYAPDVIVIVGDFFDFPQLSKFQQEPEWEQTMQATVDAGELFIAKIRTTAGDACEIVFIPGNHETRMQRAIVNNIRALYNLKRPGEKYALYSIPSLLRLEAHNIECMAEYPSGKYVIEPKRGALPAIVATHADMNKKDQRSDMVFGHLVLPGIETFAREYDDGWVTYSRMCVSGCANYSDTGDKVRLTRSNTPSGRSSMANVQSFGTIDIDRATGQRAYGLHLIRDGSAPFLGKVLTARRIAEAA